MAWGRKVLSDRRRCLMVDLLRNILLYLATPFAVLVQLLLVLVRLVSVGRP
jgi:hypothetical protein